MKIQLVNRDITDNYAQELLECYGITDVNKYLEASNDLIISPDKLINIQCGADIYQKVCNANGKILLIVDSDVDGYTSSAIFYLYTKKCFPNVQIDYRLHEGKQHGLEDHIDWIIQNPNYDLIVCPDSSSNDYEYHEQLKQLKIPVLVLDHHLADGPFSENAIIINNQLSMNYSNKDLTGAGVVYQFCRYMDILYGYNYADDLIDLAALGIDGDMGSLLDYENRAILYHGFKNIKNLFFQTLIEKQSYSMGGKITPISVAFYIVPLINAMIRVGSMDEKERLFSAFIDGNKIVPSNKRGAKGADELLAIESARECTNARSHQNRDLDKIMELLEVKIHKYDLLENKILFIELEDENFPPELNGLAAMKLSAKYKKPTLIGRLNEEGYLRGSGRGLNNSELNDFKQFLTDSNLFEYAQGHANAFGYSLNRDSLSNFISYSNDQLKNVDFNEAVYDVNFIRMGIDNDIKNIIEDISHYEGVWGTNIPEPLIYIKNIKINSSDIQIMGKNQDTLKINYNGISYMKFHAKDMIAELAQYNDDTTIILEVIGRANMNYWNGTYTPQIFIENYELRRDSILEF